MCQSGLFYVLIAVHTMLVAPPNETISGGICRDQPCWANEFIKKVSFIDSSAMPSLPGTSIGMLSMANAYRITKMVFDNDKI